MTKSSKLIACHDLFSIFKFHFSIQIMIGFDLQKIEIFHYNFNNEILNPKCDENCFIFTSKFSRFFSKILLFHFINIQVKNAHNVNLNFLFSQQRFLKNWEIQSKQKSFEYWVAFNCFLVSGYFGKLGFETLVFEGFIGNLIVLNSSWFKLLNIQ